MADTVLFEREGNIARIILNRPDKLNALTEEMLNRLIEILTEIQNDREIKVAILQGNGRSFSSGIDRDWLQARVSAEKPQEDVSGVIYGELYRHTHGHIRRIIDLMWNSPVVFIGQIQGHCIMGGWEIATFCDLIWASDDAKIIWKPIGGSALIHHLWPWTIGLRKTKELLFTGGIITGQEAADLGMINGVVPLDQLAAKVDEMASRATERPREFLYLDKLATNHAFDLMGLWNAWDYSLTAHIASSLTDASKHLATALDGGSKQGIIQLTEAAAAAEKKRTQK